MIKCVYRFSALLLPAAVLVFSGCTKDADPSAETGIQGTVHNSLQEGTIHPAFIIHGDELLATTDENGTYRIAPVEAGHYSLTCSALGFDDQSLQVDVGDGETRNIDFTLTPDDSKGRVYGEFHDRTVYAGNLVSRPEMADWNAKQLFDGVSGATLQSLTFGFDLPERQVFLGDSLVGISDGFGQYWFEIQCGTYPLTGSCQGYHDTLVIVKVEPDQKVYANFILSKEVQ
jgi:hypothetical protein